MASKKKIIEDPDSRSTSEEAKALKKQKTEVKPEPSSSRKAIKEDDDDGRGAAEVQTNKEGEKYIDLKGTKRVTVRQFKGKTLVDIREFYNDKTTGAMLPGKKGISLSVEQWKLLSSAVHQIDELVNNMDS